MPSKKGELSQDYFVSGRPAQETPMGKVREVSDTLTGEAIPEQRKDRVRVQTPTGVPLNHQPANSIDGFKALIKHWIYYYDNCLKDNHLLAHHYMRMYQTLKQTIIDNHLQYLDTMPEGQHLKKEVLKMQFDPSIDIMKIKYCGLYLKTIFPDICKWLDHPEVATRLEEPTRPFTPQKNIKEPRKDYEMDSDIHGIF